MEKRNPNLSSGSRVTLKLSLQGSKETSVKQTGDRVKGRGKQVQPGPQCKDQG